MQHRCGRTAAAGQMKQAPRPPSGVSASQVQQLSRHAFHRTDRAVTTMPHLHCAACLQTGQGRSGRVKLCWVTQEPCLGVCYPHKSNKAALHSPGIGCQIKTALNLSPGVA
jgi:hypothetical protein